MFLSSLQCPCDLGIDLVVKMSPETCIHLFVFYFIVLLHRMTRPPR